jgi:AraC family transcriptional regulator, ethanolamine operon transcriptional activator
MGRSVFNDYDEFADSISGLNGRYIPTARSGDKWWIEPAKLRDLRLQQLQVGGASTFAGDGAERGLITIGIPLTDARQIRIDGHALTETAFILIRKDRPLTYSAQDITRWAGVSIPDHLSTDARFREAAEWSEETLRDTSVRGEAVARRRVSELVELLCSGNETINIANPIAAAAAEEEVLIATARLLQESNCAIQSRAGRPRFARDRIIARCLEYLRENRGRAILVGDLCTAAQVAERTLRNVFYEYFGVGPVRLLMTRQLQEVRSALLNSSAPGDTVTAIAGRFGVWDLSLFARNYRALYGESPSRTLRKSGRPEPVTVAADLAAMQSWTNYAIQRFARASIESGQRTADSGQ